MRQIEADRGKASWMSADAGGGPIRAKLAGGKPLFNAWLSLGSPFAVELAAEAGCDLVTIDQQHGIGGHAEMLSCLMAATAGGVPALVRVAVNDSGLIGRALDAGAHGVICPMINTAEDAVAVRRVGEIPSARDAAASGRSAPGSPCPTISAPPTPGPSPARRSRPATAIANLDAILATPGLDMVCAGPNDLALTLSGGAHTDIRAPEVIEALDVLLAKCERKQCHDRHLRE